MIDLNDLPQQQRPRINMGALEAGLRDYADQWVPELFSHGWRADSGDEWIVGDISGKRPSGNGSCRIKMRGEHAGDWYDFSLGKGGQVFSTIKSRLGLGEGEVIREALRILEGCGVAVERIEGQRPPRPARSSQAERHSATAASTWAAADILHPDTLVGRYFTHRRLQLPKTGALRFSDGITRIKARNAWSLNAPRQSESAARWQAPPKGCRSRHGSKQAAQANTWPATRRNIPSRRSLLLA